MKYNAAGQKTSSLHEMQCHGMKNMAAAPTPNTSTTRLIVFLFRYLDFYPENHFGLQWKVSRCHGLLLTATPFPCVPSKL